MITNQMCVLVDGYPLQKIPPATRGSRIQGRAPMYVDPVAESNETASLRRSQERCTRATTSRQSPATLQLNELSLAAIASEVVASRVNGVPPTAEIPCNICLSHGDLLWLDTSIVNLPPIY